RDTRSRHGRWGNHFLGKIFRRKKLHTVCSALDLPAYEFASTLPCSLDTGSNKATIEQDDGTGIAVFPRFLSGARVAKSMSTVEFHFLNSLLGLAHGQKQRHRFAQVVSVKGQFGRRLSKSTGRN